MRRESDRLRVVNPARTSDKALRLRDDFEQGLHEWIVPDIFPIEIAHPLTRAERRKVITRAQRRAFLGDILATQLEHHPYVPLLPLASMP